MLELQVPLGTNNKRGFDQFYLVEVTEIIVPSVEDVDGTLFVRYFRHDFHIIYACRCHVKERGNLCFNIIQDMELDTAPVLPELCPMKQFKAKVYRCRVKSVNITLEAEDSFSAFGACFCNQVVGKFLEDLVVSLLVCLGQIASCNGLAHAQMVQFLPVSF